MTNMETLVAKIFTHSLNVVSTVLAQMKSSGYRNSRMVVATAYLREAFFAVFVFSVTLHCQFQ